MLNSSVWQYLNVHVHGCRRPQCFKSLAKQLQLCIHPGLSGLHATQHVNELTGRLFEPPMSRVGGESTIEHDSVQTLGIARSVGGTPTPLTVHTLVLAPRITGTLSSARSVPYSVPVL